MAHFGDQLVAEVQKKGTPICVGLDPRLADIPSFIKDAKIAEFGSTFSAAAESIVAFNKGIIDAVHDLVPVVKPQIAFYEQYGFSGLYAFEETVKYARGKGLIVIADAKRNDIGSTAEAYARAFLGTVDVFGEEVAAIQADALTVTPYLGYDGIKPFVAQCDAHGKGIFVLVKTSNPSSGDFQDLGVMHNGKESSLFEIVGQMVDSWGADLVGESGFSSVGAVVGATYPEQAKKLRAVMPQTIFLVPGYGAQGGGAKDVAPCFTKNGQGAVVNSSRGITFAWQKAPKFGEKGYAEAARAAVEAMKKDLSQIF